jgi:hypothetical protein
VKIDVSHARDLYKRLGSAFETGIRRGVILASQRSRKLVMDRTRTSSPRTRVLTSGAGAFDTGRFLNSWKAEAGTSLYIAKLFNDAPYAGVIEHGRRPGKGVPPGVLDAWVRRKLVGTRRRGVKAIKEIESLAFLVSRAIKLRGIPGRRILAGAMPQIAEITREAVAFSIAVAAHSRGGAA